MVGRSWCYWQEPHDDSHSWYQSLKEAGQRFEDHIKALEFLVQNLDNWEEEYMEAFDMLLSYHENNLWEWLEEHIKNVSAWVNMHFGVLQEFDNWYMKASDCKLEKDILFHEKCWGESITKAEVWLEYPNVTLHKWMDKASLMFYKGWKMQSSNVETSLKEYAETHLQCLEDYVKTLEQLLNNYTAATSKWLDKLDTSKEVTSQDLAWNLLSLGQWAKTLGKSLVVALQS
nr:PREDICTED: uncharacterized protein LOC100566406 isoform X1 [Anolis carolinensis]|eukprot:XP_008113516.1 PREDICTED: uncharacterized protein LOC100566406 isoform X1 [Anolis carolinensis]